MNNKLSLSKSSYVKGLQCPKSLWISNYRKDLKLPTSDQLKAKFAIGDEITDLARKYFKEGVKAEDDYFDIKKAIASTKNLINQNHSIIFEATAQIESDQSHARIDILRKNELGDGWDLIEVKGSTSIKESHLNDISFQYHVFSEAGYKIDRCTLMLIDAEYVLDGELDINKLFKLEDVTDLAIDRQSQVKNYKSELLSVIQSTSEPKIKIGARCFEKKDHHPECDFRHHCWKGIPEYSVFNIYQKKKAEEIAETINSYNIEDIPEDLFPGGTKVIDINCHQESKTHINKPKIKEWLSKLQYPLYFLDYETFNPAIPIFNNSRPYQQIPFQFSLHIQETRDGEIKHLEFLHKERSDPRHEFTKSLVNYCGSNGSIIVYNQSFEKSRNNELGKDFPEYAKDLEAINNRVVDLIEPFRGRFIYSPKQQSSYSIKKVLPAFTNLNYDNMEISNGGQAMDIYSNFIKGEEIDEKKVFQNLLNYCKLDTYAMVDILRVLQVL